MMKWLAFATDFDGTIATDGMVDEATMQALQRVRDAGAATFLVTGRGLKDFAGAPGVMGLFDSVVAENGGVLYSPLTKETRVMAPPPPPQFAAELGRRGIPVAAGQVIVATVEPHEVAVLELIKEMALELHVIFNKGAVMVLPAGVNKASGLQAALDIRGILFSGVVGVGDAENDHAFLERCGLSAAVANALPALKERVNFVTRSNAGAGVAELIDSLLRGDLEAVENKQAQ
ncbi:MAG: HAD family hydrolase [Terrimicrobiaceae bacterium]|nr:HAD family hydrolase [Terrimicrobiaceae bacterium]